jgi:hypothetical protein
VRILSAGLFLWEFCLASQDNHQTRKIIPLATGKSSMGASI